MYHVASCSTAPYRGHLVWASADMELSTIVLFESCGCPAPIPSQRHFESHLTHGPVILGPLPRLHAPKPLKDGPMVGHFPIVGSTNPSQSRDDMGTENSKSRTWFCRQAHNSRRWQRCHRYLGAVDLPARLPMVGNHLYAMWKNLRLSPRAYQLTGEWLPSFIR